MSSSVRTANCVSLEQCKKIPFKLGSNWFANRQFFSAISTSPTMAYMLAEFSLQYQLLLYKTKCLWQKQQTIRVMSVRGRIHLKSSRSCISATSWGSLFCYTSYESYGCLFSFAVYSVFESFEDNAAQE